MSYVLSLDPGKTTGWAIWNDDGVLLEHGQTDYAGILELLAHLSLCSAVVYEDYRLQRHRAVQQSGSRFEAVQVIGAAKLRAHQLGAHAYPQEVSSLTIAAMHSGIARPGNHAAGHWVDAVLHGYLWFEKHGIQPVTPGVGSTASAS